MIAKVRDVTVFVGLMLYVVSIASLFRIGRQGDTTQAPNFESTLANVSHDLLRRGDRWIS